MLPFIPSYVGPLLNGFAFVSLTLCWNTTQCQMEFVFFQRWWATHSGRCSFSHCGETVNIYVIQSFWRTEDKENNVVTPTLKASIMCSVRANTFTNQFLLHKITVSNHRLKKKAVTLKYSSCERRGAEGNQRPLSLQAGHPFLWIRKCQSTHTNTRRNGKRDTYKGWYWEVEWLQLQQYTLLTHTHTHKDRDNN